MEAKPWAIDVPVTVQGLTVHPVRNGFQSLFVCWNGRRGHAKLTDT